MALGAILFLDFHFDLFFAGPPFGERLENVIPKRGRHAEHSRIVLIVVDGVIRPQRLKNVVGRTEDVDDIMNEQIRSIADHKPSQYRKGILI